MKKAAIFIFLGLAGLATQAQDSYGSANFNVFNTVGEFGKKVEGVPMGVGFQAMFNLESLGFERVYAGGEIGVAMYAQEEYMETIYVNDNPIDVEMYEEDCFFNFQGVVRLEPFDSEILRPYAELRAGGTKFFSTIMVDEEYSDLVESETQGYGTSFNTGVGGGLLIEFGSFHNWGLDLGATYVLGTKTRYRNMANDGDSFGDLERGTYSSKTNNINYRLGFLMFF